MPPGASQPSELHTPSELRAPEGQVRARSGAGPGVLLWGVFLLSAATLTFEIHLTRIFSVAQFYHFAFMIVSLAMLGFGASGTWLAVRPSWGRRRPAVALAGLALGCGICATAAYAFINWVPFDSFSIAWDWRQVVVLFLHYLALALPFFCSGAVLGLLFTLGAAPVGITYAANLTGSAVGCLLALLLPALVGGEGVVWSSGALAACASVLLAWGLPAARMRLSGRNRGKSRRVGSQSQAGLGRWARPEAVLTGLAILFGLSCAALIVWHPPLFSLKLSPYKGLSYALQVPDARLVESRWNGFSRVDLVASPAIRSLPGLSYRYSGALPPQQGLFVDGDDMSPVLQLPIDILQGARSDPDVSGTALAFTGYLPTAIAYALRRDGEALILAPQGGLEVWVALTQGAAKADVVERNSLVMDTLMGSDDVASSDSAGALCEAVRVTCYLDEPRSCAQRAGKRYDVVTLALTSPYRSIRSGAYSLAEDYRYTVEAFEAYLSLLQPDGVFVASRWLPSMPSDAVVLKPQLEQRRLPELGSLQRRDVV